MSQAARQPGARQGQNDGQQWRTLQLPCWPLASIVSWWLPSWRRWRLCSAPLPSHHTPRAAQVSRLEFFFPARPRRHCTPDHAGPLERCHNPPSSSGRRCRLVPVCSAPARAGRHRGPRKRKDRANASYRVFASKGESRASALDCTRLQAAAASCAPARCWLHGVPWCGVLWFTALLSAIAERDAG